MRSCQVLFITKEDQIITWKQFPKEHTFNHNYESC